MIENFVEMMGTILVMLIGGFFATLFWSFVCVFRALVGILYPPPSRTIRWWQLATLAILILGLFSEAIGFVAFAVLPEPWLVALSTYLLGLALLTVSRVIASFIERECLEDKKSVPPDPKSAQVAQALPWKGQA